MKTKITFEEMKDFYRIPRNNNAYDNQRNYRL